MININIPGRKPLQIKNVVLDFNGTMAKDGELLPGVTSRLNRLAEKVNCYVLTADTFGTVRKACKGLNCTIKTLQTNNGAREKEEFISQLGAENTVAIGNGTNDTLMLEKSTLGILVLEAEGASLKGLLKADVITRNIEEALELLLYPKRLVATLRA